MLVRLKSGGPPMLILINECENGLVRCCWLAADGTPRFAKINPAQLEPWSIAAAMARSRERHDT